MGPPLITLIESNNNAKLYKYCIKFKLRRETLSEKSDMYGFKMALFYKGNTEESFLFIKNFKISLKASGTLAASANIQCFRALLHDKALCQLDTFSVEVVTTTIAHLNRIILGLGDYFFLLMCCQITSAQCAAQIKSETLIFSYDQY